MTPPAPDDAVAQSAIHEYLYTRQQRRRIFPRAALVGFVAGIVAVAFRIALVEGERVRVSLLHWAHDHGALGWLFPLLFGALGAAISVLLVRSYSPEATGSGIPHLKAVLGQYRMLDGSRVLPVKFFGGTLALGSGLTLGREGPTVQMGAAVADLLSGPLKATPKERLTLLAAGAGAGLAAAFNAPLSGLIFVVEELEGTFRPIVFGAAFIAAAVADIVTRSASGPYPVLKVPSYPIPPLGSLPVFLLLGLLAGGIGVLFNRSLLGMQTTWKRLPTTWMVPMAGLVGACVGLLSWFVPGVVGSSHDLFELTLTGKVALTLVPLWFGLRFLLTVGSYSTTAPGGIFAPILILGALLGLAVGQIAHHIAPGILPEVGACAVVGMAALLTAIVRAPLTGIVMILEMTGDYHQMLPVIVACFGAYIGAELLNDRPIYEALLERDLAVNGGPPPAKKPVVAEFEVEPGSRFENTLVRDLGLPSGCLLVRCSTKEQEVTPTADTRLHAHDWITAVIDANTPGGLMYLKEGCQPEHHRD
ncbi:MAG: H(+)/Cl(-) exchange transporter ClcA [Armatimonas sp.]